MHTLIHLHPLRIFSLLLILFNLRLQLQIRLLILNRIKQLDHSPSRNDLKLPLVLILRFSRNRIPHQSLLLLIQYLHLQISLLILQRRILLEHLLILSQYRRLIVKLLIHDLGKGSSQPFRSLRRIDRLFFLLGHVFVELIIYDQVVELLRHLWLFF